MLFGMRNALCLYERMNKETTYAMEASVKGPFIRQKCNKLAD